jgi:hypothetical protein
MVLDQNDLTHDSSALARHLMTSSIIYGVSFGLNNTSRFCLRKELIRHVTAFNTTKAPEGVNGRISFAMSRTTLSVIAVAHRLGIHFKYRKR